MMALQSVSMWARKYGLARQLFRAKQRCEKAGKRAQQTSGTGAPSLMTNLGISINQRQPKFRGHEILTLLPVDRDNQTSAVQIYQDTEVGSAPLMNSFCLGSF